MGAGFSSTLSPVDDVPARASGNTSTTVPAPTAFSTEDEIIGMDREHDDQMNTMGRDYAEEQEEVEGGDHSADDPSQPAAQRKRKKNSDHIGSIEFLLEDEASSERLLRGKRLFEKMYQRMQNIVGEAAGDDIVAVQEALFQHCLTHYLPCLQDMLNPGGPNSIDSASAADARKLIRNILILMTYRTSCTEAHTYPTMYGLKKQDVMDPAHFQSALSRINDGDTGKPQTLRNRSVESNSNNNNSDNNNANGSSPDSNSNNGSSIDNNNNSSGNSSAGTSGSKKRARVDDDEEEEEEEEDDHKTKNKKQKKKVS